MTQTWMLVNWPRRGRLYLAMASGEMRLVSRAVTHSCLSITGDVVSPGVRLLAGRWLYGTVLDLYCPRDAGTFIC